MNSVLRFLPQVFMRHLTAFPIKAPPTQSLRSRTIQCENSFALQHDYLQPRIPVSILDPTMSRPEPSGVSFSEIIDALSHPQIWEYNCGTKTFVRDVAGQTHQALMAPIDFPPIEAAIVAGDRVALAVDPNVPQLCEVVTGVLKTIGETQAGDIDIVLWDEATDATIEQLQDIAGDSVDVLRHSSSSRESLRYLGADHEAAPIYLSRPLVDADFVLPIVSTRPTDSACGHDLTSVFPSLADSATRLRHRTRLQAAEPSKDELQPGQLLPEQEVAWLLGVHLIVAVTANASGKIGDVVAGPSDAIGKHVAGMQPLGKDFPPPAELVIASLDGNAQQQTWANAARAVIAASRYVVPGGAIVLWTEIADSPAGVLAGLADLEESDLLQANENAGVQRGEDDEFPLWDDSVDIARSFARIAAEHRVLIHSQLDREAIEPIGIGAISNQEELTQLSQSFKSCGVLRSAQFAGSTIDAPHRAGLPQ